MASDVGRLCPACRPMPHDELSLATRTRTARQAAMPAFNSGTKCVGSPPDCHPDCFLAMDAWMTSQLSVALIRKLCGSLICLALYFSTCYQWVFVQLCTGRRPVNWYMNWMSALYYMYILYAGWHRRIYVSASGDKSPLSSKTGCLAPVKSAS